MAKGKQEGKQDVGEKMAVVLVRRHDDRDAGNMPFAPAHQARMSAAPIRRALPIEMDLPRAFGIHRRKRMSRHEDIVDQGDHALRGPFSQRCGSVSLPTQCTMSRV